MEQKYKKELIIIDDTFINEEKESSFEVALFCLLNQILEYNRIVKQMPNKSIILFDRTPFDNLLFLKKKRPSNKYNIYIDRLEKAVRTFMSNFNHIILLSPDNSLARRHTSFLSPIERMELKRDISKLYRIIKPKLIELNVRYTPSEERMQSNIDNLLLGKVYNVIDSKLQLSDEA